MDIKTVLSILNCLNVCRPTGGKDYVTLCNNFQWSLMCIKTFVSYKGLQYTLQLLDGLLIKRKWRTRMILSFRLRKGNVFTSVCQEEFCPQGGEVYTPWGRHPQAHTPWVNTPWADTPPGQTATAADGAHHTRMHSCFIIVFTGSVVTNEYLISDFDSEGQVIFSHYFYDHSVR